VSKISMGFKCRQSLISSASATVVWGKGEYPTR
jgi:hypothetical protein